MLFLNLQGGCSDNRQGGLINHQMNSRHTELHFMLPFIQKRRTNHDSNHQRHHEKSHQKLKNGLTTLTRKLKLVPISLLDNTDPFTHHWTPHLLPTKSGLEQHHDAEERQDILNNCSWSPITGTQAFQRKRTTISQKLVGCLLSVQAINLLVQNQCVIKATMLPKPWGCERQNLIPHLCFPSFCYWLAHRHKRKKGKKAIVGLIVS